MINCGCGVKLYNDIDCPTLVNTTCVTYSEDRLSIEPTSVIDGSGRTLTEILSRFNTVRTKVTVFANTWEALTGTEVMIAQNGAEIKLEGFITLGHVGFTAFVLPAGQRPNSDMTFITEYSNASPYIAQISVIAATGAVQVNIAGSSGIFVGSGEYVSLNGVNFFVK